eukprot:7838255-Pyramimonas_sp.AAC.1
MHAGLHLFCYDGGGGDEQFYDDERVLLHSTGDGDGGGDDGGDDASSSLAFSERSALTSYESLRIFSNQKRTDAAPSCVSVNLRLHLPALTPNPHGAVSRS